MSIKEQFFANGKAADCPVYDMHGHMGPSYGLHIPWSEPEMAVTAMDRAGVRMLVFCHHGALFASTAGNKLNIDAVRRAPERLRAYCGINPNYPDIIEADLASFDQHRDVFVGFKFLADYHQIPLSDARCKPAWDMANEKELLVLLHTWGGSEYDGFEEVWKVAESYPKTKILMGHSIHGQWDKTVELVKRYPHVYIELCAVVDERGPLEKFVDEVGSEQIVFGTDFPWFDFHYYIGAILGAGLSDDHLRNIFYKNAERLLKPVGVSR